MDFAQGNVAHKMICKLKDWKGGYDFQKKSFRSTKTHKSISDIEIYRNGISVRKNVATSYRIYDRALSEMMRCKYSKQVWA